MPPVTSATRACAAFRPPAMARSSLGASVALVDSSALSSRAPGSHLSVARRRRSVDLLRDIRAGRRRRAADSRALPVRARLARRRARVRRDPRAPARPPAPGNRCAPREPVVRRSSRDARVDPVVALARSDRVDDAGDVARRAQRERRFAADERGRAVRRAPRHDVIVARRDDVRRQRRFATGRSARRASSARRARAGGCSRYSSRR